jgi:hypothetical protein
MTTNPLITEHQGSLLKRRIAPPPIAEQMARPAGTSREASRLSALIRDHQAKPAWIEMTITQPMALAILDRNIGNRKINRNWIDSLKVIQQEGRLLPGPDCPAFDTNGHLRNGQHRMISVAETGIPMTIGVMFGMDPAAFDIIDSGRGRKAKHYLDQDGVKNGDLLATVVRFKYRIEHHNSDVIPDEQAVRRMAKQMHDADDTLERAVIAGARLRRHKSRMFSRVTFSSLVLAYWLIAQQSSRNLSVDEFWDYLVEGHRLERNSPIHKLRDKLASTFSVVGRRPQQYLGQTEVAAWIILAWNAWITNDSLSLRWNAAHELPAVLPTKQ